MEHLNRVVQEIVEEYIRFIEELPRILQCTKKEPRNILFFEERERVP